MADRRQGRPVPETDETIAGEDWYARDLTGREWVRTAFNEVDLTETTSSSGSKFTECAFRGVRFNVSSHCGAAFENCTFRDCNFFGATFDACKFIGSTFTSCSFDRVIAHGGDWSFVGLVRADLRTATIEDARMREADLSGARCDGAIVRRVDLSGALLAKANFDRCDLRGSDLSAIDPATTSLNGAIINWDQAAAVATSLGLDVRAY